MKWIPRAELKQGMYVVQYGSGGESDPVVLVEHPILDGKDFPKIPAHVDRILVDDEFDLQLWQAEQKHSHDQTEKTYTPSEVRELISAALLKQRKKLLADRQKSMNFALEEQKKKYASRISALKTACVKAENKTQSTLKAAKQRILDERKISREKLVRERNEFKEARLQETALQQKEANRIPLLESRIARLEAENTRLKRSQTAASDDAADVISALELDKKDLKDALLEVQKQANDNLNYERDRFARELENLENEHDANMRETENTHNEITQELKDQINALLAEKDILVQALKDSEATRASMAEELETQFQQEKRLREEEAKLRMEEAKRVKLALDHLKKEKLARQEAEKQNAGLSEKEREIVRLKAELESLRNARNESGSTSAALNSPQEKTYIEDEIVRADKLYGDAVDYAREFLSNAREGKPFDFHDAMPTVDGFIDSVFRNESAAAALCKLRSSDEYTYTHSINVAVLSIILGKHLKLSKDKLRLLGIGGVFHDVGKAVIPDSILNKPGKLTDEEMAVMRTHPQAGYEILKQQPGIPEEVLGICLEHHERYDGNGYPRGLSKNKIGMLSRIVSVVDVYDALTAKRVYKDPLPPSKVLGMMYQWRLSDFHPNIVEHFIKSLGVYPVGSLVQLTNGDYAVVVDHNADTPLKPVVKIVLDRQKHDRQHIIADLAQMQDDSLLVSDIVNPSEIGVDMSRFL